jgi:hypothetical protein
MKMGYSESFFTHLRVFPVTFRVQGTKSKGGALGFHEIRYESGHFSLFGTENSKISLILSKYHHF